MLAYGAYLPVDGLALLAVLASKRAIISTASFGSSVH